MRNVRALYFIQFLLGFVFWYAIEKLFMKSIGINDIGVGINAAVLYTVILLCDIPSGILADRWNRKYTLLLGGILLTASSIVLALSSGLPVYLIGTVLFGLYVVCMSGTLEAFMYDSLKEDGMENYYDKYQGRARALFMIGIALSSVMSGYVAEVIGLSPTFLVSAIPSIIATVLILFLHEPALIRHTYDARLHKHIISALRLVRGSPLLAQLGLFVVFDGLLRNTMNEFGGVYYIGLGLSAIAMGYVNAGKWLADALGQLLGPLIGRKKSFVLLPLGFVSYLAFSLISSPFGIIFFFIAALSFSISLNQTTATMQDATPSHVRATTFSMFSFGSSILFIPLSIVFGFIAEQYSIFTAFAMFGVIGIGYAVFWMTKSQAIAAKSTHK